MLLCYMKWAVIFNFLDQLFIIVVVCFLKGNVRDPILLQSQMLMIPMANIYLWSEPDPNPVLITAKVANTRQYTDFLCFIVHDCDFRRNWQRKSRREIYFNRGILGWLPNRNDSRWDHNRSRYKIHVWQAWLAFIVGCHSICDIRPLHLLKWG